MSEIAKQSCPAPRRKGKRRLWLRLRDFVRRPAADHVLVLETLFWLVLARLIIHTIPFRFYSGWLGQQGRESESFKLEGGTLEQVKKVVWSVRLGCRSLPWTSTCLAQAMATKALLRRRRLASTLYLGVTRPGQSGIRAHAWLRFGDLILTGAEGREEFTIVARFSEPPTNQPAREGTPDDPGSGAFGRIVK